MSLAEGDGMEIDMEYRIKTIPEDFIVTELPILDIRCCGDFCYYILSKRGISTFEAIEILCDTLKKNRNEFDYAGLKDEEGITTQYISCKGEVLPYIEKHFENGNFLLFRFCGFAYDKMSIGHLYGNGFNITIRNLSENILKNIDNRKKDILYVNYYDTQRFGMPGKKHVTHLLGRAIEEDNKIMIDRYCGEGGQNISYDQIMSDDYIKNRIFFLNSWQSFLWNQQIKDRIISLNSPSLYYDSVDDITFALVNQESLVENYRELSSCNNIKQYISVDGVVKTVTNTREVLKKTTIYIENVDDDEIYQGKKKIKLRFLLDKGVYATMVVKHFLYNMK